MNMVLALSSLPPDEYKQVVESFAQAVWETDAQGQVVTDSPSWRAYTGQSLEEWLDTGWVGAVHPHDRTDALHQWQKAVRQQTPVNAEFRLRSCDGGWRWTDVRATRIQNADGSVRKWVGLNIDISERKRTEEQLALDQNRQRAEALQASRNLLRATLDSSMDLIQVFEAVRDEQGAIIDFIWVLNNHAAETIYGDVVGKRLLTLNPGVIAEGIFDTFKQVVETGIPDVSERQYTHEQFDGWFHQSVVKLNDGVATTTADITSRKKAEQQLTITKQSLQAKLDSSLYFIQAFQAVRDDAGQIVDFTWTFTNTMWNQHYGDVIGKSLLQESPGVVETGLFDRFVQVTETGVPVDHEQYYSHEQFHDQWFHQTLVKMGDGFVMNTEDITGRKRAEAETLQLKDQLAQKATDKYLTLFNGIDEAFCIIEAVLDAQGDIVDFMHLEANSAYYRHNRIENIIGRTVLEIIGPAAKKWIEYYGNVIRTGVPVREEYYVETLDRWYTAFHIQVENTMQVAIIFNDITERKQREQEQALLLTLDDKIRQLTDPVTIEGEVTQLLRAHFDVGWCYYVQWNEVTKRGVVRRDAAGKGLPSLVGEHDVSDVPEFLELLKANPLLHVSDYEHYELLTPELRHRYTALGFRSMLVATLVKQERLVASLLIGDTKIRHWSAHEEALLMQVAERTWAAVERAKAEEALRKSESRLAQDLADAKRLQHFSNEVIHLDELDEIYELLLHTSTSLMQSDFTSLQLYSEQTETLTLVAHKAFHPESATFWRTVSAESGSVCGEALRRKLRILVTDVETEEFAKSELEIFRLSGIRAVQSTPIKSSNGKLIGMLNTQWKQPRRFSEDEFRFFDVLVRQAADFIEKRQAEEALRESEEKYRSLFDSIDEGFALLELIYSESGALVDFSYKETNPAFIQHVGMNLQGRRRSELFFDKKDFLLEKYDQLARTGEPLHLEYSVQRLDSQWFQMTASRIGGEGSRLLGVVFRNITERKQREQHQAFLLQLSDILRTHLTDTATLQQAALQLLAEQVDVVRAIYCEAEPDQDTFTLTARFERDAMPIPDQLRLSDFSPTVADAYRSGRTQLVTDTENEPFPEAYRAIGIRAWLAVPFVRNGRLVTVVGVHAKTPRSWTAIEVQLVEEFATRIWAAVERARAEEVLRATEQRLRTVLQQAPLAIAITGPTGEILFRNTVFDQLWGRPAHNTSATTYSDVYEGYHLDGRPVDSQEWPAARAVLNGEIIQGEVLHIVHLDGRRIPCSHNAAPIRDETGAITGGVVMLQDISVEWAVRQELEETARRKDEFLAMLGHELRNPLSAITNTLLVLDLTQGQDESMSYAKGIQILTRHSQHLNRMVNDLLDMSRIRQGIVRLQWTVVNLNQLLQLTVETALPQYREQNRQLTVSLPDKPLYVKGDEVRLAQVVMNLLTNGAKYTNPGGTVWVSLEPVGDQAIIRVADDGIGLTSQEQTSIFEVFVQGATSLDRPLGGLGLGLSVAKHLVEGHGGQIQASSPGPNQGSEFIVRLPILSDLTDTVADHQENQLLLPGRVLVVDDNVDFANMTARLLRSKGFEVYTRYSGAEGLAEAESLKPDALLLDIGMPYMDGYEVCRQIRAQPWGQRIAIIALTGYGLEADKQKAAQAGFDGHLLKPVNLGTMAQVVAGAIDRKKFN